MPGLRTTAPPSTIPTSHPEPSPQAEIGPLAVGEVTPLVEEADSSDGSHRASGGCRAGSRILPPEPAPTGRLPPNR